MESFRFRALAAASLLVFFALTASATPTGNLSVGITANGGVTGSASLIDWYLPLNNGFGDFTTGNTTISWSGGTLTGVTNPYGRLLDLTITNPPAAVPNFIQFYAGVTTPSHTGVEPLQTFPAFDLIGVGPSGAPLPDCAGVTSFNVSCQPRVTSPPSAFPYTSPLVLTYRQSPIPGQPNFTDISLAVTMNGRDATGSALWSGGFTAQLAGLTPNDIEAVINAGQTLNLTSFSGNFTSAGVPEPATYAFLGSGLLALGFAGRRRLRKQ